MSLVRSAALLLVAGSLGCSSNDVYPGASRASTGGRSVAEAGRGGAGTNDGGASGSNAGKSGAGGAGGAGSTAAGAAGSEAGRAGSGGRANDGGRGGAALGGSGGRAGAVGAAGRGGAGVAGAGAAGAAAGPVSLPLIDDAVFYDGYAGLSAEPVPEGVLRLRNDLLTHRLTESELGALGSTLRVEVVIGAACDNYDRIGSVALALVPKGRTTYVPEDVERIEVGRYITPFMDMNREPKRVSYAYAVDNLIPVLADAALRAEFDFWFELELFGVPYAANDEIAGCANRSDVFHGTLTLRSDTSAAAPVFDTLLPLAYKLPFNDYQKGASDKVGTTRKTLPFVLDAAMADAQLVLITSNHGANSGGEEYSRRDHFVYVDGALELSYKPGRASCEPFRKSNTQANGIYGSSPRGDADWQSFSNWCPGDVIDTRVLKLGPLAAGSHEFVIDVPDAHFADDQGDIPLSLYLQARRN